MLLNQNLAFPSYLEFLSQLLCVDFRQDSLLSFFISLGYRRTTFIFTGWVAVPLYCALL